VAHMFEKHAIRDAEGFWEMELCACIFHGPIGERSQYFSVPHRFRKESLDSAGVGLDSAGVTGLESTGVAGFQWNETRIHYK
jgi:hypothetical protein